MARASGTQPPVFANVGGGPGARGLQRMSETTEECNLDGRWKVGSGDGSPNQAGCQNYRWKRSPRPVRCVSEPGGGMPDEVCFDVLLLFWRFVCPCSGSTQSIDFRRRTEAGQQPEPSDWRDTQRRGNSRRASKTRSLVAAIQTQTAPCTCAL